jgi:Protein of unknown function (DUF3592)
MLYFYIGLILLAAFPLVLTIWRMKKNAAIKKKGIHVNAVVTNIKTVRTSRGGSFDLLTLEYKERATGRPFYGKATVSPNRYKRGAPFPVAYLPDKPASYAVDSTKGYWAILIFCILLFLFVLFAIYKINEMMPEGEITWSK